MALSIATSSASRASADREWNYEVFLSFRGADTRGGITLDIYRELQNTRGIETFIDDRIEVGSALSPTLLKAIKESRFAIVVLSKNYAGSAWCLDELTTIFQCMEDKNRIFPLFYKVNPSDVRYQKGTFGKAFENHESRHGIKKVKKWKDALSNVADLSGWDSRNYGDRLDKELVEDIVKLVYSKVLQVRIETSRDFEKFEATTLALSKVMEVLQDHEVTVIGLCGIKGVGKTTLVKHAGAQARVNGLFNKVIMAVLSKSLDLRNIQDQLGDMLALKFEKDTQEKGRAIALQKAILRENKLLIMLDDVWRILPLSRIGIPNKEELQERKSKVLFTTRIQKLCQEMNSDVKINLSVLSEEDSLKLLSKKMRLDFHEPAEIFSSVVREVARNCAGVPVALTSVASELRDKDLDEWKKAAERVRGSQSADPEGENYVFNCIKLCNESSSDAKSYLLLFCLFPEDYDIFIEDVFRYGFGKGMFQGSNTLQEARARADLVVKSLKDLGLLLVSGKKGCVKMHHVIRDVALSISSSEDGPQMLVKCGDRNGMPIDADRSVKYASNCTKWPDADIDYSAISLINMGIENPTSELVCPKSLQILSLKNSSCTRRFSSDHGVFQSQDELRVLDLRQSSMWYRNELSGNKITSLLPNLRVLLIDCDINASGPEFDFGKLGKLEILSIRQPVGFPEDLGYLSRLRMLDVSKPYHDRFPPQVISRLIKLEELYMKGKFIWGRKDHKEKDGNQTDLCCQEFIGLPNLNVLEVQIQDVRCLPKVVEFNPHWVKFDITFGAKANNYYVNYLTRLPLHESQKSLCLKTTINNLPDWFHKVVTETTERLVYYSFRDVNNILMEYGNGRLNAVKFLTVIRYNCPIPFLSCKWRELMNTVKWDVPDKPPVFENLEELHVEDVPCMELCIGELPLGSFCNLKKFKVLACLNMKKALFSSNLLKKLQNLEELICGDLWKIKYVFGTDGMESGEQINFIKLRKIHLRNLRNLIDMCNGPASPNAIFQNLKYLAIGECSTLKYVFSSHSVLECFVQLDELYVYKCPNLEAVIGASEEGDNCDMIVFPKLKILFLVALKKLTRFYGTVGSHRPIVRFPKLEQTCFRGSKEFDTHPNHVTIRCSMHVQVCDKDEHDSTRQRLHNESKSSRSGRLWIF